MIKTTLLITLLVALASAGFTFHPEVSSEDRNGLCAISGSLDANNAKTVQTFSKGKSSSEAASQLCGVFTRRQLKLVPADTLTCTTLVVGTRTLLSAEIVVASMGVAYECTFFVNNTASCAGANPFRKSHTHKRQQHEVGPANNLEPCNTYTDVSACLFRCDSDVLYGSCACFWDDPSSPDGFPLDHNASATCTPETPCCWNRPCSTFITSADCANGGGGDSLTNVFDRCVWVGDVCQCAAPLIAVPVPANQSTEVFPPFDCLCPVEDAHTSSVAQCAILLDATREQQRQIHRFAFRVALAIGKFNLASFIASCPKDRVRLAIPKILQKFAVASNWLRPIVTRISAALARQGIPFIFTFGDAYCDFVTEFSFGHRVKSVAETELSTNELQQLEPIAVTTAPSSIVTLSTALTAALVARFLL